MSSSPLRTSPGFMERARGLTHLCLHNSPLVSEYAFYAHRSVNGVFGDPADSGVGGAGGVELFRVQRGLVYRSPSLRRSGRGQVIGSIKGQTHVVFNIEDFASAELPHDDEWLFVRVQEKRSQLGWLAYAGIPEATVTLNGVLAGDKLILKGVYFQFAAGANALAGKAGTLGDPFLVGLGANDNAAAVNLAAALNDNGDVAPALDVPAPVGLHTRGTATAPSVLIQPENGAGDLVGGEAGVFTITSSNAVRVVINATALVNHRFTWVADVTKPVQGPILCIPTAVHFGTRNPSFTLWGTAPSSSGSVAGSPPDLNDDLGSPAPRAMHLRFPNWLSELTIRNVGVADLLVSLGADQPMRTLPVGEILALTSGAASTKEILLACPTGTAGTDFTLHAISALEM